MRRILLTLAENVTETHCGSCPHIGEPHGDWCSVWGALPIWRKRLPECLAAEAAAARMVEIAPEDAKILHMLVGDYADQWDTEGTLRQLRSALRAHAAKTEVKR